MLIEQQSKMDLQFPKQTKRYEQAKTSKQTKASQKDKRLCISTSIKMPCTGILDINAKQFRLSVLFQPRVSHK